MRSRNYTNEIGVNSGDRPVSAGMAFAILAVVAVVAILFIRQVVTYQPAHQDTASAPVPMKVSSR
jgi:hypothetical protein